MHRWPTLTLALALTGCASGPPSIPASAGANRPERIDIEMPTAGGNVTTQSVDIVRRGTVTSEALALPVAQAWPLLLEIYADLKLPMETVDAESYVVGINNRRVSQINGKRVRSYFDCGLSYVTGGRDIYVVARTQLSAHPSGGTLARTQVEAYAKSNESSGGVRCSSTGALETLIAERLQRAAQSR